MSFTLNYIKLSALSISLFQFNDYLIVYIQNIHFKWRDIGFYFILSYSTYYI